MLFSIYTPDRVPVGLIEAYTSMIWTRRYYTAGAFELTMPFSSICKDLVTERLVVKGSEAGIIENINIAQDAKTGENVFKCSGRFLPGYFDRRILYGVNSYTGTPEDAMRYLVTKNAISGDRAIPGLTVAASTGLTGSVAYVNQNANLLTELAALAEAYGLGFRVGFSTSGLTFRIFAGKDRSVDQSTNPRAIFSRAFENILKQEYDGSTKAVKNYAYVDGKYTVTYKVHDVTSNTDNDVTVEYALARAVGTATGRDRREIHVDAGDVTKNDAGTILTAAQRNAAMDAAGAAQYVAATQAFEADVDPQGNLVYGTDYDLGDIVTVESRELGMRINARITEVKEVYEESGLSLTLTLGYGLPNFAKTVRWLANG